MQSVSAGQVAWAELTAKFTGRLKTWSTVWGTADAQDMAELSDKHHQEANAMHHSRTLTACNRSGDQQSSTVLCCICRCGALPILAAVLYAVCGIKRTGTVAVPTAVLATAVRQDHTLFSRCAAFAKPGNAGLLYMVCNSWVFSVSAVAPT